MTEREYLKLKAKLQADYNRDLDALDRVFRMGGGNPQTASKAGSASSRAPRGSRGVLTAAIHKVLAEFGSDEVTARKVYEKIAVIHPDAKQTSVSSALVRLAGEDGPLEVVTEGKGKRGSVYRNRQKARVEKAS